MKRVTETNLTTTPATPRTPKLALAILLFSLFISVLGIGFVAPLLPVLATELGATGFALGFLMAAFSLSMGIIQPVAGSLSDRYGRKFFLAAGMAIYSACGFSYILASSVADITVIRFLQGFGGGLVFSVSMAYMGDLAPPEQEGRYMGAYNVALFAGFGLGPILGGILKDSFGMTAAFYAMGASSAAGCLIALVFLPESYPRVARRESDPLFAVFRAILAARRMRGILLVRFAVMLSMVPSFVFLPVLMTQVMGASGIQIGGVIAARTLVGAALLYPFGWVADRYNRVALTIVSVLGMAGMVSLIGLATQFWHLLLLFGLLGVTEALFMPANSAMTLQEGRSFGMGATLGVFNAAMAIGMFTGSIAAGLLVDQFGFTLAFALIGATVALSVAISGPMMRNPSQRLLPGTPIPDVAAREDVP